MAFDEVAATPVPKKPVAKKPAKQKKFKPFDLVITVSSMADLDFLQVLCSRGLEVARGHGGFSSVNQAKALALLTNIHNTLSENAGV